ncbi:hypothetical protein [Streptomyces sp. NPDC048419]|uniref:hypothetical protein n=1 Tax=Streptomyces sp. NPDC048419 TaxID=3365547 RepID=UPI00372042AC
MSDAVGDVLGVQDLGPLEVRVDQFATVLRLVVRARFVLHGARLTDPDAHMALGDFLAQGLGEGVHDELRDVVDTEAIARHTRRI